MVLETQEVWPLELLTRGDSASGKVDRQNTAVIILNQPIADIELLARIWANTEYRVCADGGANRLFDLFSEKDSDDRDSYVRAVSSQSYHRGHC